MSEPLTTSEVFSRVRACAWCDRFYINGEWIPRQEAISRLNLDPASLTKITHGICPDCIAANPVPPRNRDKP